MKKYEFTGETKENIFGATLHRIRAVRDFGDVKAGDLGGWIENEGNLSHAGTAWVYDNAILYGDARVYGDARISDNALISGDARIGGNAWVYGNAQICGNAQVYGYAQISGNAWLRGKSQICGNAEITSTKHFIEISPIGNGYDYATFYRNKDNGITAACGCFLGGIDEFLTGVEKTHGDSRHGQAYRAAAEFAKIQIDLTEATYEKE